MTDQFPSEEFDEWAESYDESVSTDQFPFYGYKDVLTRTVELARAQPGMTVLDLGTGTGSLAALFARRGCEVWGTDFSAAMLEKARQKLPQAHFALHDLRRGWPEGFPDRFDRIVSAYVFHHFELEEKVRIINSILQNYLYPDGKLIIADISFTDHQAMEAFKISLGNEWEEEYYWMAEDALPRFQSLPYKVQYQQISECAGVFTFEP
jgi:putative AdoMet-dependent methyltransferase